jgi:type VI secretion system protein ImpA
LADESAPCGVDLEYDNEFLSLNQAAAGKPETQFDAGSPPDWRAVREHVESLFERTRDLRIAVLWVRAGVSLDGLAALPQGLRLLCGLLDTFWETLHPLPDPDDADPYARMNALSVLSQQEGLLGDLRHAVVFNQRGIGELHVRSIEITLNLLAARDGDTNLSRDQLMQMLADAVRQQPSLRTVPESALAHLKALNTLINERAGIEAAPDLKPLHALLNAIAGVMPAPSEEHAGDAEDAGEAADGASAGGSARASLSGAVRTRDDALRAIDMVCEFLERTEPPSPAPLLLRRARRMINRNFLQLMKELAPDALAEVARVMGVDPETVQLDDSGSS